MHIAAAGKLEYKIWSNIFITSHLFHSWCPIISQTICPIRMGSSSKRCLRRMRPRNFWKRTARSVAAPGCRTRTTGNWKTGWCQKSWKLFIATTFLLPQGPPMKSSSISPCVTSTFLMRPLFLPSPLLPLQKSAQQWRGTVHVPAPTLAICHRR